MKNKPYDIAASNESQNRFLMEYDDIESRLCAQCGGNDGYLYATTARGEWLCKSCYDDHKLESYRERMRGGK